VCLARYLVMAGRMGAVKKIGCSHSSRFSVQRGSRRSKNRRCKDAAYRNEAESWRRGGLMLVRVLCAHGFVTIERYIHCRARVIDP
jgi:hypothetical protein